MEIIGSTMQGIYRDILKDPTHRVIYDSGWNSNTIVDQCRILLAGFMRRDTSSGIQYLAVGRGEEVWDDDGIPDTNPSTTIALVNQAADPPVANLDFVYLNEAGNTVAEATQRIQITGTLGPGYPVPLGGGTTYPLREFGLFGRFGSTDFMINCVRHPVIHKGPAATLIRVVQLYF